MKTAKDPRHLQRIKIMQSLYSWDFNEQQKPDHPLAQEIIKDLGKIDECIKKAAPEWPVDKINKIDLAILRLAAYELVIADKTPPKVVVDEAVELGKEYGSQSSASFINGALGQLIKDQGISA